MRTRLLTFPTFLLSALIPALGLLPGFAASPVATAPPAAPAPAALGIPVDGLVQGPGGAPLAGARVELVPAPTAAAQARLALEGKTDPEPRATAATGADGTFRLEAPESGMWKVVVKAPGLVPQEVDLTPLVEAAFLPAVKLEKDAGLEVKVTGTDGAPIPGARVEVEVEEDMSRMSRMSRMTMLRAWDEPVRMAVTDAKGVAVLPRSARETKLTVRAGVEGRPYVETELTSGSLSLKLPAAGAVRQVRVLRVLDAAGKKPVDAWVLVGDALWAAGRTSPEGLFDVPLPPSGRQKIVVVAEDGRRLVATVEAEKAGAGAQIEPRSLRLPALESLTGRIVSAVDGKPLASALVWSRDPGLFRRTGADGVYRIDIPSSGEETFLQAAAAGHFPDASRPTGPEGRRQGPVMSLEPALAASGVVVDEGGRPVGGVEIRAIAQPGDRLRGITSLRSGGTFRTTPAGRFRLSPLAAEVPHEIRLTRKGFAPATVELAPLPPPSARRPAPELRYVLRQGRTGFGHVVDPSDQPIAGARVSLRRESTGSDMRMRMRRFLAPADTPFEGVTGTDGRFEIRDLPAGNWSLEASGAGWAALTVPGLTLPEGAGATDLGTLVLTPGVAVEGVVVDPRGQPLEGVEVKAASSADPMSRFLLRDETKPGTLTGPDGFFRIEDRRPGDTVDLAASRAGYGPASAPGVRAPTDEPVRLVMQPTSAVEGKAVDGDGKAVAGAQIVVLPSEMGGPGFSIQQALSDETGAFRVEDVTPGTVDLRATAARYQSAHLANLEVRAGQDLKGVEVVLAAGASVEGRVLSPAGRPVGGATVRRVEKEGGRRFFAMPVAAQSDGDGRYRLEGVAPGPQTFDADLEGYRRAVKDLDVRMGENALDLTLEGGAEIRGRVVDDGGVPVPGAQVSLREGRRSWDLPNAVSGADGSFTLAGVGDGIYRLFAEKQGYASDEEGQEITVSGSSVSGVEVRLSRGGAIAGQLLGLDFTELSQVRIQSDAGRGQGTVRPDGSYRIENVAPGERRVTASVPSGGRQAEGKVTLEPGVPEVRLDLDFAEGVTLTGRVLRNGEPLTGEMISISGPEGNRWSETDHTGQFLFKGVPEGTYDLTVMTRGGARHQESVELSSDRDVLIELRTVSVSGQVTDAGDRSPISGASVVLLPQQEGESAGRFFPVETSTDSLGAFRFLNVTEGSWRIKASQEGYAPAEEALEVSGSPVEGVELKLQATEGITLEVMLPTGRPPVQVRAAVIDASGRTVSVTSHNVGENGRVRISSVAPGAWELLIDADGWASQSLAVTAPGDAGRVVLPSSGGLTVEVPALAGSAVGAKVVLTDAAGKVFRTLRAGEVQSDFGLEDGRRELQRVTVGAWTLTVTAADGRTWTGSAVVTPNGKATVRVE